MLFIRTLIYGLLLSSLAASLAHATAINEDNIEDSKDKIIKVCERQTAILASVEWAAINVGGFSSYYPDDYYKTLSKSSFEKCTITQTILMLKETKDSLNLSDEEWIKSGGQERVKALQIELFNKYVEELNRNKMYLK